MSEAPRQGVTIGRVLRRRLPSQAGADRIWYRMVRAGRRAEQAHIDALKALEELKASPAPLPLRYRFNHLHIRCLAIIQEIEELENLAAKQSRTRLRLVWDRPAGRA